MSEENNHRIIYAYYSASWVYKKNGKEELKTSAEVVMPEDFTQAMKGKIFCPLCFTPLHRSPDVSVVTSNNITAHFKHGDKEKYVESALCPWRTRAVAGLNYNNEEEVRSAIENKDLTIVSGWRVEPPQTEASDEQEHYNRTAVEDENGPETEIAIGRHVGDKYLVPSKITSITSICRNFPLNLVRGFYFPNSRYPMLLSDQLYSVERLTSDLPENETLFFGKIVGYRRLTYRNIIYLKHSDFPEIKIYTKPDFDERKRIDIDLKNRYLIFSGLMYWESVESIPACKVLAWGAYSILPEEYEKYLPESV